MLQTAFGLKIKELRNNQMISQNDLSAKSGIERAQISKIEQGKVNVTLGTIDKLCKALKVSLADLMDIHEEVYLKPFVKWAGGKSQILDRLKEYMPKAYDTYYEPFVGGGALLFALAPKKSVINDNNDELMCVYRCLKDNKLYTTMIKELIKHEKNHSEDYYYSVREKDKEPNFKKLSISKRAARMIYLNKACFNGLYRVNSKGYFNVPFGKKKVLNAFDRDNMKELRRYFASNDTEVLNVDYKKAVENAKNGDFVYFDPPYDTWEEKDSFTAYSKESFGKKEQKELSDVFKELSNRGVKVMLSNHNTKYINELYKGFNIHVINAKRMINSKADGRGDVEEVIITNY